MFLEEEYADEDIPSAASPSGGAEEQEEVDEPVAKRMKRTRSKAPTDSSATDLAEESESSGSSTASDQEDREPLAVEPLHSAPPPKFATLDFSFGSEDATRYVFFGCHYAFALLLLLLVILFIRLVAASLPVRWSMSRLLSRRRYCGSRLSRRRWIQPRS